MQCWDCKIGCKWNIFSFRCFEETCSYTSVIGNFEIMTIMGYGTVKCEPGELAGLIKFVCHHDVISAEVISCKQIFK